MLPYTPTEWTTDVHSIAQIPDGKMIPIATVPVPELPDTSVSLTRMNRRVRGSCPSLSGLSKLLGIFPLLFANQISFSQAPPTEQAPQPLEEDRECSNHSVDSRHS